MNISVRCDTLSDRAFWISAGQASRKRQAEVLERSEGQLACDVLGKGDYALALAFTSVCRTVLGAAGCPELLSNCTDDSGSTWDGDF